MESNLPYSGMSKPFTYNPPGTGNSQNSISVSTHSHNTSFYSQDGGMSGERVRVAVRIRPLMRHEKGHQPILEVESMKRVFFTNTTGKLAVRIWLSHSFRRSINQGLSLQRCAARRHEPRPSFRKMQHRRPNRLRNGGVLRHHLRVWSNRKWIRLIGTLLLTL